MQGILVEANSTLVLYVGKVGDADLHRAFINQIAIKLVFIVDQIKNVEQCVLSSSLMFTPCEET